jgi:hypothetical protein
LICMGGGEMGEAIRRATLSNAFANREHIFALLAFVAHVVH